MAFSSSVVRYLEDYSCERLAAMPERSAARSFRDLVVWKKAHELVLAVYRLTESFPDREKFGLSHQMRRAAVSGQHRRRIRQAQPSRESPLLKYRGRLSGRVPLLLILTQDLGYGQTEPLMSVLEEASRLLNAYTRAILAPDFWLLYPEGISRAKPLPS
jgi:hypothetical protein